MTLDVPKRCELVVSFIFILAGRSKWEHYICTLWKTLGLKWEIYNVSSFFQFRYMNVDIFEEKKISLNCRLYSMTKYFFKFMPFHVLHYLGVLLYRGALRATFHVDDGATLLEKWIIAGLVAESPPVDCGRSSWWHMPMIWPLWWH